MKQTSLAWPISRRLALVSSAWEPRGKSEASKQGTFRLHLGVGEGKWVLVGERES